MISLALATVVMFLVNVDSSYGATVETRNLEDLVENIETLVEKIERLETFHAGPPPTLLMKLKAGSKKFNYDSPYWTNTDTLNPDSTTADASDDIDAKLPAFNTKSFQKLLVCYNTLTNCYEYDTGSNYNSAQELFSSGFQRSANLGGGTKTDVEAKRSWTDVFLPPTDEKYDYFWNGGSGTVCGMLEPGINSECVQNKVRIGYCTNLPTQKCQQDDGKDADSAVGIGLHTQNYPAQINAPFGEYFIHGVGEAGILARQHQAWLFAI